MEKKENLPDYYEVLGVKDPSVGLVELKKAYRKARAKAHPDAEGGDAEKFMLVEEAWGVLGDDSKREAYDSLRRNPPAPASSVATGSPVAPPHNAPQKASGAPVSPARVPSEAEPSKPFQQAPQPSQKPAPAYKAEDKRTDLKGFAIAPPYARSYYPHLLVASLLGAFGGFLGSFGSPTEQQVFYLIAGFLAFVTPLLYFLKPQPAQSDSFLRNPPYLTSLGAILLGLLPFVLNKDNPPAMSAPSLVLLLIAIGVANYFGGLAQKSKWEFDQLIPAKTLKEGRVFGKISTHLDPVESVYLRQIQEKLTPVTFNIDGVFLTSGELEGAGFFLLTKGNRSLVVSPLPTPGPGKYGFSQLGYITGPGGKHFPHRADLFMELISQKIGGLEEMELHYLFVLFPQNPGFTEGDTLQNVTLTPLENLSQVADVLLREQENLVRRDYLKKVLQVMP